MKKKTLLLGLSLAAISALGVTAFTACGGDPDEHTHTLVAYKEVPATCGENGTKAYWQCSDSGCQLYFSDAEGKIQITAPETIVSTGEHSLVYKYEDENHWQECKWCGGAKTEKEPHGEMIAIGTLEKDRYFEGETLDVSGLNVVLECYDECGYSVDITEQVTVENAEAPLALGTESIIAKYGEQEIPIEITVEAIVCTSIKAELKAGVQYYDNGIAIPKASDFTVTAKYNNNTQKELNAEEYTVSAVNGFAANGGLITISLKGVNNVKDEIDYELVGVALESLTIKTQPNNTTFGVGETVSLEGLVLLAAYNDGTQTEITEGYTSNAETSYDTEGEVTVTVLYGDESVEITLTISNETGAVTGIEFASGAEYAEVYSGSALNTATVPAAYKVYANGKKEPLESDEYSISYSAEGTAVLGTKYTVTATLTADTTKTVTLPVKVLTRINGNQFTDMAGGAVNKSEKEYVVGEDGTPTVIDRVVPYVGGFSKVAEAGGDAHVTWTVPSSSSTAATITFRAANSYLKKVGNDYQMDALQVNSVADLYVNGEKVSIPDSVVLTGSPVHSSYAPLYNIYFTFTIEGLTLAQGDNRIMIIWKNSTLGQKNCWNETPSTMNIDHIEVATLGAEGTGTAADATVSNLVVYHKDFVYGDMIQDYQDSLTFLAIMSDGSRKILTADEVDLTVTGDITTKPWFVADTYSFTVALKSDGAISKTWSKTIETPAPHALEAYGATLKVEDNKVYLILALTYIGDQDYTISTFDVFDGGTHLTVSKIEQTATQVHVYCDITGTTGTFYTHMKIDGAFYDNGQHANNGDFKQSSTDGSTFTSTLTYTNSPVSHGGKTYSLKTQWNMAVLEIS